jgi:hypothetical protein
MKKKATRLKNKINQENNKKQKNINQKNEG